jgi:hypothetical protein
MAEKDSWAVGSDTDRRVDVEDARAATSALLAPSSTIAGRTGFLAGPATQGQVTANGTPNATVNVAAFQAAIANPRGIFPYIATLDSTKSVDVLVADPSDPTNPRRDLIIAQQSDAFYGDASSPFEVKRITGTPAASPSDPTVTGSPAYITLARITVTAGATTITSGMITDLRPAPITVARGGVIPCTSSTRPASPYGGMVIHETDTGKTLIRNATTAAWEEIYTAVSGQLTTSLPIRTTNTGDVSLTSTGHAFQIGATSGANLRIDNEEMQTVSNGVASTLRINASGGLVQIGAGGLDVDGAANVDGAFSATSTASFGGIATFAPATGSGSKAQAFNHSYAIWVDNVAADGGAGSRMWIDTPNDGDVVIGPRGGSDFINQLRLRTDSTTGLAANVYMNPTGNIISRSTSSLRYKVDVEDLVLDLDAIRALRPVRYRDRSMVEADPETTQTYIGLIAEEVHALGLYNFVSYMEDENGELIPDGVQYDRLTVALHLLVRKLEDTVTAQADEIAALQDALAALTARVEALETP